LFAVTICSYVHLLLLINVNAVVLEFVDRRVANVNKVQLNT